MNDIGFRTQIIGGFQRDDVLRYIEQTNREFTEKLEGLEKELEKARQDLTGQNSRNEELNSRNVELSGKNAELLERLGAITLENDDLREALETEQQSREETAALAETMDADVSALREKNAALEAEMTELRRKCSEYEASKEHMAEIELRAYRQAKELEAQSKNEAARVQKDSAALIDQLKVQFRQTHDGYRAALQHAQEEMAEMQKRSKELLAGMESAAGLLEKNKPAAKPEGCAGRTSIAEVISGLRGKDEGK